jgi:hypothetical protein
MTICVLVKVSEGLVLAADSTAAIEGRVGAEQSGILKTYDHVRKLSHIKDYPIGTLTWGTALVGTRSVESLVKEYEYGLLSLKEEEEKARLQRREGRECEEFQYSVKKIASDLLEYIQQYYDAEFGTQSVESRPFLGLLVAGYSSGQFFPEHWLFQLPNEPELKNIRPDKEGKPDFGAHWYGLTDAIIRLHWGRDERAIGLLAEHFKVSEQEIHDVLQPLQYPVSFAGMPLQDAIDYAVYLINVAIGRFRFVIGAPLCGGEIDVAIITPKDFTWVRRKTWKVD